MQIYVAPSSSAKRSDQQLHELVIDCLERHEVNVIQPVAGSSIATRQREISRCDAVITELILNDQLQRNDMLYAAEQLHLPVLVLNYRNGQRTPLLAYRRHECILEITYDSFIVARNVIVKYLENLRGAPNLYARFSAR
jgi:hypothetical protein